MREFLGLLSAGVGCSRGLAWAHNPKVAGSNPAPATIDDEGLADAATANPFRLPRLHPGIGRRAPSLSAEEAATINEGFVEQHTVLPIREAGQLAMLEPACEPSSLARPADQLLDWSWKSRLKVQQLGPKRRDLNTSHLLVHRAHLGLKSLPLVGADTLSRCSEVFRRHAIHYVDGSSTSHEQNMRRESGPVNRECHFRI